MHSRNYKKHTFAHKNTRHWWATRSLSPLRDWIISIINYSIIRIPATSVWFLIVWAAVFSYHRCFSLLNVLPRSLAGHEQAWLLPGQQDAASKGSWLGMPAQSEAGGVIVKPSLCFSLSLLWDKAIRQAGEKPAQRSSSHSPDPGHAVQAKITPKYLSVACSPLSGYSQMQGQTFTSYNICINWMFAHCKCFWPLTKLHFVQHFILKILFKQQVN